VRALCTVLVTRSGCGVAAAGRGAYSLAQLCGVPVLGLSDGTRAVGWGPGVELGRDPDKRKPAGENGYSQSSFQEEERPRLG
jgi:hypothetical protein